MSEEDSPALRYYRSLIGAWSGAFTFEITGKDALRAEKVGVRFPVTCMALLQRVTGPGRMSTTLAPLPERERTFLHTTRVTAFAITLYETMEEISVTEDLRSFIVKGTQRPWPRLTRPEAYEGRGHVDPSAASATYFLPWMGKELVQRTQVVPTGLSLTQETAWSRGHVLLERR